jgi:hypothetical protein
MWWEHTRGERGGKMRGSVSARVTRPLATGLVNVGFDCSDEVVSMHLTPCPALFQQQRVSRAVSKLRAFRVHGRAGTHAPIHHARHMLLG